MADLTFSEQRRFDYPLTKDSLVIDGGGYQGGFAKQIAEKYGCRVICYEPVDAFRRAIVGRILRGDIKGNVLTVNSGLGGKTRMELFGVSGDSSGIMSPAEHKERVEIVDICTVLDFWLADFGRTTLDLLKLNVENMEMECMEALLDRGYISRIDHLQVQPHSGLPDAERRWNAIKNRMLITHKVSFEEPMVWIGWERAQ